MHCCVDFSVKDRIFKVLEKRMQTVSIGYRLFDTSWRAAEHYQPRQVSIENLDNGLIIIVFFANQKQKQMQNWWDGKLMEVEKFSFSMGIYKYMFNVHCTLCISCTWFA